MKRNILYIITLLSFVQICNSQPIKLWSKLYGGNNTELAFSACNVDDSLFAFVGSSNSTNIGNKGLTDMIIGVVNKEGSLKNLKTFGSPQADQFNAVDILPNGNLICVGQANGSGGDVALNYGLIDGYILSYNPKTNTKVWGKNFGGSNNDQINDVKYLEPGKIIFVGNSKSADKDMPGNAGLTDAFVATVDEAGTVSKVKNFAGSKDDFAKKVAIINEASFFVAGETVSSNEGAFLGLTNKGKKDVFVLKLNRNSNQLSIYMLGTPGDDILADIVATPDGGNIVVVNISMAGGDVDSIIGGKDILIAKYDNASKLVWKKIIGGTKDDEAVTALLNPAGELVVTATSNSTDVDIAANYGDKDIMMFKLDQNGNIVSFNHYGGSRGDAAGAMLINGPNTFLVSSSFSLNNDLPNTNTAADFWILNLFECSTIATNYTQDLCLGDTATILGKKFFAGNTSGRVLVPKGAKYGCDSIVDVEIILHTASTETLRDTFCNEGTTTINNVIFDKNKTKFDFSFQNQFGCDSTLFVDLYFADPIAIIDSMLKSDNGSNNGYIHLSVIGGTPPYNFEWSNGNRTIDLDNVRFGVYTVVITDAMSCIRSFSFVVKNTVAVNDVELDQISVEQIGEIVGIESNIDLKSVKVYNLNSNLLAEFGNINKTKFQFNKRKLTPGLYILEIEKAIGTRVIKKIVLN
ncbi:MAG: hypothetical protein ABI851_13245 [Saprospiraceae bacterium]